MFAESNKRSFNSNKTGREQIDLFIKRIEDVGDLSPRETLYSRRAFCCLKIDRPRIKYIRQLNSVPVLGRNVSAKTTLFQPERTNGFTRWPPTFNKWSARRARRHRCPNEPS